MIGTLFNSITLIYLLWKEQKRNSSEEIRKIVKKESQNSYNGENYIPRVRIDATRLITGHSFVSMRVKMGDKSWGEFMGDLSNLVEKYNEQEEI